jgi:excisionase family DNA binding protein
VTGPILNHTIPEVARIIRCSAVNVYKLIRTGELVAVRFGKRYIVTDEDLRRFIEGHRTGTGR